MSTDEVSRFMEPGLRTEVLGEEVEIRRFCGLSEERGGGVLVGGGVAARKGVVVARLGAGDVLLFPSCGLSCVWIRVLTTSRGHVSTPAMPPAVAPVVISRPRPISGLPAHCLAHFCSCS